MIVISKTAVAMIEGMTEFIDTNILKNMENSK